MSDQRAAVYLRVSTTDQVDGYSLDAQRHGCQAFASSRAYQLVAEYADEGVSAHTDNLARRPAFARMLADAEAGAFGVIVVHKMDRFSRKLKTTLEVLERLGRARVGVVSVSEPNLDYSTPQGFLFLSMLGALAEWYSRNLSAETAKGWAQRKRSGLYAGRLPYGVMKGVDRIPTADPETHPGLLLAFERAAAGATDAEVADSLNAAHYRPNATARRARFTKDALRVILQNRFYVGELPVGKRGKGGWLPGAHQPIVPPALFAAAQQQRAQRALDHRVHHVPPTATVHVLSGLVRCVDCGEPMHLGGRGGVPRLWCTGRRQNSGCQAPSVKEQSVADEVGAYLKNLRVPADTKVRILAAYRARKPERAESDRQRQLVEAKLKRLSDMYLEGDYERSEYEARRAELRAELARYETRDAHGSAAALSLLETALRDTQAVWDLATDQERNGLLRALFSGIDVQDQRVVTVRPRPEFQPFFVLANEHETTPDEPGWKRRARGVSSPELSVLDLVPVPVLYR